MATEQTKERQALSVSELNDCIRQVLEGNPVLRDVFVQGEISGAKLYASGHLYFSLKDADSVISAVMFRSAYGRLRFTPENGMKVIIRGRVTVYPARGQYQLCAETMVPDGAGALAVAFEQLKNKLNAEGLFDSARKKPLPPHPRRIGIITSPSGAAVHDIIRVTRGRCPSAELLLFPTLVQGVEAAKYLCSGVVYFNKMAGDPEQGVDLIIIGRGGGSQEDLWCFNDERLARTIAASAIPVISAVGHEVDFSISDFVADRRAATPSAAAEMAVPDREDLNRRLDSLEKRMSASVGARLTRERARIDRLSAARVLSAPEAVVTSRREKVEGLSRRLDMSVNQTLDADAGLLRGLCGQLEALSPLGVLGRGYTLVRKENGHLASRASMLEPGEVVTVRFADGSAQAEIKGVQPDTEDS